MIRIVTLSEFPPDVIDLVTRRLHAAYGMGCELEGEGEVPSGALDDEQKARFNALAEDQRKASASKSSLVQSCGNAQPAAFQWPGSEIEARLHLNDTQRAKLGALQDASTNAADTLKAACQPDDAVTPPARLAAADKRLDAMLRAVKLVRPALEDFYATLSDEQKAQFEAIGPRRTS